VLDVSPRAWLFFLELFAALGISRDEIVAAVPELLPHVRGSAQRLDWEVFCRVCDELARRVSPERLRAAARGLPRAGASRPLAAIAQLVRSPLALHRAVFVWFAPALLAVPRYGFETIDGQHARATMTIDPPHRSSEAIFLITAGMLEGLPGLMGLPSGQVTLELTPRQATFVITSPARPQPRRGRLLRLQQLFRGLTGAVDELVEQEQNLRTSLGQLERLEQVFRNIINGLPDAVIVHRDGVIIYANPAVRGVLELGAHELLLGRHLRELTRPAGDGPEPGLATGSRVNMRTSRGDQVLFEIVNAQAVDFGGAATILVLRDVTHRRDLEVRLAVADRMLSMGTLAAGVAHEINNPLSYVIANLRTSSRTLERLADDLPDPERNALDDMLSDALEGAERVRAIVADLGSFARPDDGTIGAIDVAAVVERTVKLADNQLRHHARLVRNLAAVPLARGNEGRLGQVLLNLLIHAAKASAGSVDCAVILDVQQRGDRVAIAVGDTGPGIPEADRARIFDPYFSSRPMAVGGLGLSICHGLVTGMGGTIEVTSRAGVGTTFTVLLGVATREPRLAVPVPLASPRPLAPGTRPRVLVVDDDLRVARALARALEGCEVTVEDNGALALARLLGGEFDLVFCDLMMPSMSGMELHRRLAEQRPGYEQRLIFMTGGAFTPEASEFLRRVDNRCLAKPFGLDQVLALVRER
jgi:signal transduction histidine kinase